MDTTVVSSIFKIKMLLWASLMPSGEHGLILGVSDRLRVCGALQCKQYDTVLMMYQGSGWLPYVKTIRPLLRALEEDDRTILAEWAKNLAITITSNQKIPTDAAAITAPLVAQKQHNTRSFGRDEDDRIIKNVLRLRDTPLADIKKLIARGRIDWLSNEYNLEKAYLMACWSELAYLQLFVHELDGRDRYKLVEPSDLRQFLIGATIFLSIENVISPILEIPIRVVQTERYIYTIMSSPEATVIAVRGTIKSLTDVLIDIDTRKTMAMYGFHHTGFDDEARIALPLLIRNVGNRVPVYITGHSLGAAVAAILSNIWPLCYQVQTPYIFAPPRFGSVDACIMSPRYQFIQPYDLITHLPPRLMGYSDAGATTTLLPIDARQRSFISSALFWLCRKSAVQHRMERHRQILGELINIDRKRYCYVDAFRQAYFSETK